MNRLLSSFIIFAAAALASHAELVTYPAGEGVETLDDYSVRVSQAGGQWHDVAVYPIKVDQTVGGNHSVKIVSMAYFDFGGEPVEVEVVSRKTRVANARVRPASAGVEPQIAGDTLRFTLAAPANLSVEVNGDIFSNLHLFANPIDLHRPSAKEIKRAGRKGSSLIYFGPGVHELEGGEMKVPSGSTVYVDGGARVVGQLIADGVSDVSFYGRGEIHPRGRGEGIYIKRSKRVDADGVIVTQIPVGGSDSVRITNVKSISSYGWGDGMNVFASNNVSYDRVFCRNSDDCSTVYATRKGFVGGCRNITMENSTLWADVAHPIMIGLHGSATDIGPDAPSDTIENILYRNLDILDHCENQIDYQGCFGISCGDNNVVRDVTFDNIRVDDFRRGQLVNIRIFFNKKYCKAPGQSVSNVLFRDVNYTGQGAVMSVICGYNEDRRVSDITFENLVINGQHIADDMPGKPKWYKTSDYANMYVGEHVDNVTFK